VAGLLWWEYRRSLRRLVDSKAKRDIRNLAVAGLAAAAMQLIEFPVAIPIIMRAQRKHSGLLQIAPAPGWVKLVAAILLLDYTLYFWHRLTHRISLLWRFHQFTTLIARWMQPRRFAFTLVRLCFLLVVSQTGRIGRE
jgi:sterol desaturase/sphingolipid hydroxylase (fatty acid hydroxylase superfamily)